jgi:putative transposase
VLTDGHGVPVGLAVAGANRHDMKLVRATIDSLIIARPTPTDDQPHGLCLDKGYDFAEVRDTVAEFGLQRISGLVAKKPKPSSGKPASARGAGWSNARIVG